MRELGPIAISMTMSARRVSVAEAKNRLPSLIREAESSEDPVEITRRGKTVAVLFSKAAYDEHARKKEGFVAGVARIRRKYVRGIGLTEEELATLRARGAAREPSFDG